ncbi:NF038104 family lipoprotein [Caviibacterium pharyngocola]|uniref:Stress responsive alpha-beta barrel n=1 Tax=Caviibacterium pharyngocola TaxID=28159 RepID=A0A2M8RT09_9PAST|nr:NF038104 family lipoprotein [Caviibacterium pharyngocola]PJG82023.1 stress responsive alpha-beta barrel [Caviibacterium pharyngocola]
MKLIFRLLGIGLSVSLLGGCIVTSAVGLAVDAATTVGKVAVKTTGAVVDAVIPDGDDD